jgi:hypothetical protein
MLCKTLDRGPKLCWQNEKGKEEMVRVHKYE